MLESVEKYRNIPFSDDTPDLNCYKYSNIKDLAIKCEMFREDAVKCRTVGVLSSDYGKFYISEMDDSGIKSEFKLQVSLLYFIKPALPSTIIPYPVQVFGILQWKKRPVIFIKRLQVLSIPIAIRIKDIMSTIAAKHLALCEENNLTEQEANSSNKL